MAIYHLSAKPISRAHGRSATGAAAYRAGCVIADARTGVVHDYRRKGGVVGAELTLPGGGTADRAEFWNALELHHKRGDAVLAREVEVALPRELSAEQRQALVVGYARELADRYGVAADVALHAPHTVTARDLERNPDQYHEIDPETGRRHNGNWHAHIMLSACHVEASGKLGKKAVELDPIHCQRAKIENMADRERARWAELVNEALSRQGHEARVDHRSLAAQGIDREPTRHLGPAATGYERRKGEPSRKRMDMEADAAARLARAQELGRIERQGSQIDRAIIDLSGDLSAALREREALAAQAERDRLAQEQAEQAERDRLAAAKAAQAAPPAQRRPLMASTAAAGFTAALGAIREPQPQPQAAPPAPVAEQPQASIRDQLRAKQEQAAQAEQEARSAATAYVHRTTDPERTALADTVRNLFDGPREARRAYVAARQDVEQWSETLSERRGAEALARRDYFGAHDAFEAAQSKCTDTARTLKEWREAHKIQAAMGGGGALARAAAQAASALEQAKKQARDALARHTATKNAVQEAENKLEAVQRQHEALHALGGELEDVARLVPLGAAAIIERDQREQQAERDRLDAEAAASAERKRLAKEQAPARLWEALEALKALEEKRPRWDTEEANRWRLVARDAAMQLFLDIEDGKKAGMAAELSHALDALRSTHYLPASQQGIRQVWDAAQELWEALEPEQAQQEAAQQAERRRLAQEQDAERQRQQDDQDDDDDNEWSGPR